MRTLLALAALLPAFSAASSPPADSLSGLFAGTCMKYFYSQDGLREAMRNLGSSEVPSEKAEFFLGNKPGKAWFVITPSTAYVVALRDDTVCAVFAQRADAAQVRTGFVSLVGTAPQPMVATVEDPKLLGPNDNAHIQTVAYSWSRPKDKDELLFVLTTSDSSEVTAQAMASMSLVSKAEGPR